MRTKYKIVFLGDQSVGKTTLISQYTNKEADTNYHPTIGIDFTYMKTIITNKNREKREKRESGEKKEKSKVHVPESTTVRLQLWDTAGQERFNSIIPNYTRNSFIAVVLFDLAHPSTFEHLDHWIKDLVLINDPDRKIKVIIVGNKRDLVTESVRENMKIVGIKKAECYGGRYVETCAMRYENIMELVEMVEELIWDDFGEEEGENVDVVEVEAKSKGCC